MEFDPHAMNKTARELLAGVEADAKILGQHCHTRAVDRARRKVEKLAKRAPSLRKHITTTEDQSLGP